MSWLDDSEVTLPKTEAEKLAEAQAKKIKEINAAYTEQVQPLINDYPEVEQQTWIAQEQEARAYLVWHDGQQGDAPETPVLNSILVGRNGDDGTETMQELCLAVRENANMFTQAQQLTGKRHRLVKQVRAAKTEDVANAVSW